MSIEQCREFAQTERQVELGYALLGLVFIVLCCYTAKYVWELFK